MMGGEKPRGKIGTTVADVDGMMSTFTEQMREIARLQRERAALTARATAGDGRVTVTVNADCVLIAVEFSADVDRLGYDEIARATLEAGQQAAEEIRRRSQELLAPLQEWRKRLPKVQDVAGGIPDVRDQIPTPPPVSLAPPGEREEEPKEPGNPPDSTDKGVSQTAW
jgi:DNA-binding protein YbaB